MRMGNERSNRRPASHAIQQQCHQVTNQVRNSNNLNHSNTPSGLEGMFGFAQGLGQNSSFGFSSRPIFPLVLRVPLLVPND